MKSKNLISLLLTALLMASCTNEMNEIAKDSFENVSENLPSTRSLSNDTIDLGELVCLEETEELLNLKRRYEDKVSESTMFTYTNPRTGIQYIYMTL